MYEMVERQLEAGEPSMRCTCTWRSVKWRIEPRDFRLGLRLFEEYATDEVAFWCPDYILREAHGPSAPWVQIAQAVHDVQQQRLDESLLRAMEEYSPLGYRIALRGFKRFAEDWNLPLIFPES
jgi:hypothetical protein